MQITYYGTYTLSDPAVYGTATTMGCFTLIVNQASSGSAGQARRRNDVASGNAVAAGVYTVTAAYQVNTAEVGPLQSVVIYNLSPTSGIGLITIGNGLTGPITITGSTTQTIYDRRR